MQGFPLKSIAPGKSKAAADERDDSARATGGWPWKGLLGCLFLILLGTQARIWRATSDPNFDSQESAGMLKSDPALLQYISQRILAAEGALPADFRANARVQHPGPTDLAAEFTVGQEFLLAWAYQASGSRLPLHLFATQLMALLAALSALGIFGVVYWRTGRQGWALAAAALFCLLPANYRTIGFILVREDLSLPLFLGHLALLARAEQRRTAGAYLLAGLLLALALSTWHAMGFFVVLELCVLQLWFLRPGNSPFEGRGAWAVLIGPILAATLVPAMQTSGLLFSLAMQLSLSLLGLAWWRTRYRARHGGAQLPGLPSFGIGMGLLGLLLGAKELCFQGASSYTHVFAVIWAKLAHLGVRPVDPRQISFDARLLWQGPFETLAPGRFVELLGWGLLLLLPLFWSLVARRRQQAGFDAFLMLFLLAALPTAWLIGRTSILVGSLLPLMLIPLLKLPRASLVRYALGLVLALQALSFVRFLADYRISWYEPRERQLEIAELVHWVEENLEVDEPVVGDFMNSTAILVHSGNPIVLQPKYETERSRRRAERFLEAFFAGSPEQLSALVRGPFQSELLLVDRYTLGSLSPWVAGYPGGPAAGSVGAQLLSRDAETLAGLPGYELIYRSRLASDFFRLYRLR